MYVLIFKSRFGKLLRAVREIFVRAILKEEAKNEGEGIDRCFSLQISKKGSFSTDYRAISLSELRIPTLMNTLQRPSGGVGWNGITNHLITHSISRRVQWRLSSWIYHD